MSRGRRSSSRTGRRICGAWRVSVKNPKDHLVYGPFDRLRKAVATDRREAIRSRAVCGARPLKASGADEELPRLLELADPVHLDDDNAFATDIGEVDQH